MGPHRDRLGSSGDKLLDVDAMHSRRKEKLCQLGFLTVQLYPNVTNIVDVQCLTRPASSHTGLPLQLRRGSNRALALLAPARSPAANEAYTCHLNAPSLLRTRYSKLLGLSKSDVSSRKAQWSEGMGGGSAHL